MTQQEILAIKVHQWLAGWNDVQFDAEQRRRRPPEFFLLFKLNVGLLRRLTGIERRSTEAAQRRIADEAIQRRHSPDRSEEIRRFVDHGYPWSTLSRTRRESGEYDDLKMPGWLPTAVIINIVPEGDVRRGRSVASHDLVRVVDKEQSARVILPEGATGDQWEPSERSPLEIIDGQHRLWAFQPGEKVSFELPVVAFFGLDVSWQAYIFWTVNIKPKKINMSLAFDLYPLLRTADWLERAEGLRVYREARAQELTELLWALEESPWHQRINMLGEGRWGVSQAAWIRSLLASFIKSFRGSGVAGGVGGLFGEEVGEDQIVLPWTRPQQAAFLIFGWRALANELATTTAEWAQAVRDVTGENDLEMGRHPGPLDAAFASKYVLLSTDQGVRGFLYLLNDFCFVKADDLDLPSWIGEEPQSEDDVEEVRTALKSLEKQNVAEFMKELAGALVTFDWRTSATPGLTEAQQREKSGYRGSGGYRLLRQSLVHHLEESGNSEVSEVASDIRERLGLEW